MNQFNSGEEGEKEIGDRGVRESIESTKSGLIVFIKDKDKLKRGDICHAHGETYLSTSNYFKNGQERIKKFQTKEEINFYVDRLRAFMDFVWNNTRKEEGDPTNATQLVEKELKRLENISEEDFNKTDKGRKSTKLEELSVQEILNDPGFSNEIDKFFGLNGKSSDEINVVYTNGKKDVQLTKNLLETLKQQTISKINVIKADETLTSSEKQEKLQENQARLEKLNSIIANNNNNNPEPFAYLPVLGTVGIVALLVGLIVYQVRKNKRR